MKIERIFEKNSTVNLEDIINSLFVEKIDKHIKAIYSTNKDNHSTSSKGDVI